MNEREETRQDERLDRTVAALRSAPVSPGPPDETLQAVLAAGRADPKGIVKGRFTMNRITKLAAAILIIAGIGALIAFFTIGHAGATVAWADVQEYIRNARTVTMKVRMHAQGTPEVKMVLMFKEPGLMRQEMIEPEPVLNIMDMRKNKMIAILENEKKVVVMNLADLPEEIRKRHEEQDFLSRIKKFIEESETELGTKEINGREAEGYRIEKGRDVFTAWVDARTGELIEVESTFLLGETTLSMTDFEFDVELDDSLFSLEVPEGYTLMEQTIDLKVGTTEDIVAMLRIWAQARGGTFPDALSPNQVAADSHNVEKEMSDAEGIEFGERLARAFLLIARHRESQYSGKGVKLGDAEKAVFWYRPKGSETYKVIYGDLRIEDVAEEDLPTVESPEKAAPAAE